MRKARVFLIQGQRTAALEGSSDSRPDSRSTYTGPILLTRRQSGGRRLKAAEESARRPVGPPPTRSALRHYRRHNHITTHDSSLICPRSITSYGAGNKSFANGHEHDGGSSRRKRYSLDELHAWEFVHATRTSAARALALSTMKHP
jgi:hypothetical protein